MLKNDHANAQVLAKGKSSKLEVSRELSLTSFALHDVSFWV